MLWATHVKHKLGVGETSRMASTISSAVTVNPPSQACESSLPTITNPLLLALTYYNITNPSLAPWLGARDNLRTMRPDGSLKTP